MHDSPTLTWREVVQKYQSTLLDELTANLDSAFDAERTRTSAEIERVHRESADERDRLRQEHAREIQRIQQQGAEALDQAQRDAQRQLSSKADAIRQETVESWNQSLRRLRQAESRSAVFELLVDLGSAYASRMVVLTIEKSQVVARHGVDEGELTISVSEAAAITSVIETKDPMIAAPTAAELSQPLAETLGEPGGRVYLFPLVARQEVIAILLASGNVNAASLEFLSGAAGLRIEAFPPATKPAETPPATAATPAPARSAWDSLSEEEQRLHLQAQRIARVKIAELRLYHADELRKGVAERNIYGALREQIESIRTSFLQTFLAKSDTMVDYLHLELVRSLAHDDDRLLGESYPGPMV